MAQVLKTSQTKAIEQLSSLTARAEQLAENLSESREESMIQEAEGKRLADLNGRLNAQLEDSSGKMEELR